MGLTALRERTLEATGRAEDSSLLGLSDVRRSLPLLAYSRRSPRSKKTTVCGRHSNHRDGELNGDEVAYPNGFDLNLSCCMARQILRGVVQ